MGIGNDLRERWFVSFLSIAAALFFLGALLYSAATYVAVMDARQGIELVGPVEGVELLSNGSLALSLSIDLRNPSTQEATVTSISWTVNVRNTTASGTTMIPLVNVYKVPLGGLTLGAKSTIHFSYNSTVTDASTLAALRGYVNYSHSQGDVADLESLEYIHDFRVQGWIGDYDHDYTYSGERYLNDLVKLERRYVTEVPV